MSTTHPRRFRVPPIGRWIVVIVVVLIATFPVYWMFNTALSSPQGPAAL